MKNIITYGTFDTFHYGHLELLIRASEMGDRLFVGVSTDEFNLLKGKKCSFPYNKRLEWIQSIKFVYQVFGESTWEQKSDDIKKYNISTLVMGDDWKGKFDKFNHLCEVKYLSRTPQISSTNIKSFIK